MGDAASFSNNEAEQTKLIPWQIEYGSFNARCTYRDTHSGVPAVMLQASRVAHSQIA